MYWEDGEDRRVFFVAGMSLFAVDAVTGKLKQSFGDNGIVNLRADLDRDVAGLYVTARTPGIIYKDLLILGSSLGEGPSPAAPGHVRAYDVRSGQRAWIFHTIPHPGEYGYDTWPQDAWQRVGGANSWSGLSLDEKRGIVYVPTGSPTFDFWGGDRIGQNLFGNCLIALNAESGERIWHFQTIHHDLWDRDLPMPPNLITITKDGKQIDAVAQVTKSGHIFVFDREDGEPVFDIEEKAVPASDLPGEVTWPTQPFPVRPPPISRQFLYADSLNDLFPESAQQFRQKFAEVRSDGQFVPPSRKGTVIFPGFDGGGEWGGAAFDPETGILYVNANEMPWIMTMVDTRPPDPKTLADAGQYIYSAACASCHGPKLAGDTAAEYPALLDLQGRISHKETLDLIDNGKGKMPSFGFLSQPEKEALLAFLYNLGDEQLSGSVSDVSISAEMLQQPFGHTGYNRFVDENGFQAVKPPWGTINAIDMNRGEILWQLPLGEYESLQERGIPRTGTENYGGPVVTAGGLIFIGATKDEKFRALNKRNGALLWETRLPAGGYATPCTYELKGKQYVVIACGGGKMGTKSGDSYIAFALP
jgi:quinoprotein glucose dehydrogenase